VIDHPTYRHVACLGPGTNGPGPNVRPAHKSFENNNCGVHFLICSHHAYKGVVSDVFFECGVVGVILSQIYLIVYSRVLLPFTIDEVSMLFFA
jgi:hypothetical protein